jgi:hypothetical protein
LHICVIGINHYGLLQCALWGFNGGEIEWGNPYKAIHVDILHQAYLGVFKTIIDILHGIALASINSQILSSLDNAFLILKNIQGTHHFEFLELTRVGIFPQMQILLPLNTNM